MADAGVQIRIDAAGNAMDRIKALTASDASLRGAIVGLAAAGVAAAVGKVVSEAMRHATAIKALADRTSMSFEALQVVARGVRQSGQDVNSLTGAVSSLQRAAVGAVEGTTEFVRAFQTLRIDAQQF